MCREGFIGPMAALEPLPGLTYLAIEGAVERDWAG
jgi:hypothetical protein